MLFVRGVADMITRGQEIEFVSRFSGFRFLGEGDGLGLPMPFWFALAGVAATVFLMHRTIVRSLLLRDRRERRGGAAVRRPGRPGAGC